MTYRRVYCRERTARKIVQWCQENGYDYWRRRSDLPKFDRYITVEAPVATLIVGTFTGCSLRTQTEQENFV